MSIWDNKWSSNQLYEHPVPHNNGIIGRIVRFGSGAYRFQVGSAYMSCPQEWAARIEHDETDVTRKIRQAIDLLAGTKHAFKSTAVEEARKILEAIIK